MAAVLTIGDEKTTGLPGSEDGKKDDVLLVATLGTGAEETMMEERVAVKLLVVCLAVVMARTTEKQRKQNKHMARRTKQTAPHTTGMHNTCDSRNSVCHIKAHDSLTTADQH